MIEKVSRNNKYVENFIRYCNFTSEDSIKTYEHNVYQFIKWFESGNRCKFYKKLKSITTKDVEDYMTYNKNTSSNTQRIKFIVLKLFFAYLKRNNKIETNPCDYDPRIKKQKRVPKHYTKEDCDLLLSKVNGHFSRRNKMIIELFIHTGLRLAELVALNVTDIKKDHMIVRGKGKHERTVYLNEYIKNRLKDYITNVYDKNNYYELCVEKDGSRPLFVDSKNMRISKEAIYKYITRVQKKNNLKTGVHVFRHTFATFMLQEDGTDLEDVRELLGHMSVSTTEIYTSVAQSKLKKAVSKNPMCK